MSRNKDIKYLHQVTGLPYSECRKKMKAYHWDVGTALGDAIVDDLSAISYAGNIMLDSLHDFAESVKKAFESLDPLKEIAKDPIQEIAKALEEDLKVPEPKVGMLELNFHDEVKRYD